MEKDVKANEEQLRNDLNQANVVFKEAKSMLAAGIKSKNVTEINIAQGLLEVAKKNIDKTTAAVENCRQQRHEIDTKRRKNSCKNGNVPYIVRLQSIHTPQRDLGFNVL